MWQRLVTKQGKPDTEMNSSKVNIKLSQSSEPCFFSSECSLAVQELKSGCVKSGQFVCLPEQQSSRSAPVSCPSGHSGVSREGIDVENHPFCFCFPVLLSYSHFHCSFIRLLPSIAFLSLSLLRSLFCLSPCAHLFFLFTLLLPADTHLSS